MPHLSCKGFHYEMLLQQLIQILDNTQALFNSTLPCEFVLFYQIEDESIVTFVFLVLHKMVENYLSCLKDIKMKIDYLFKKHA